MNQIAANQYQEVISGMSVFHPVLHYLVLCNTAALYSLSGWATEVDNISEKRGRPVQKSYIAMPN